MMMIRMGVSARNTSSGDDHAALVTASSAASLIELLHAAGLAARRCAGVRLLHTPPRGSNGIEEYIEDRTPSCTKPAKIPGNTTWQQYGVLIFDAACDMPPISNFDACREAGPKPAARGSRLLPAVASQRRAREVHHADDLLLGHLHAARHAFHRW